MPTWTIERLQKQLISLCSNFGRFPKQKECIDLGLQGFYAALSRKGGLKKWWKEMDALGFQRTKTDLEYGWGGEDSVESLLRNNGFVVTRDNSNKCHYDLLIDSTLRIDVKTTQAATFVRDASGGQITAWFYRIGKRPTVDLIALYRGDKDDAYLVPWFLAPETNITITDKSKYECFRNNFGLLRQMIQVRADERDMVHRLCTKEKTDHVSKLVQLRNEGKTFTEIGLLMGIAKQTAHKHFTKAVQVGQKGDV